MLAGGPQEPRRYSSLAQARDDFLWYRPDAGRDVERDGEIVGWAWSCDRPGHEVGDRSTADWLLHRGPRGGLRWEKGPEGRPEA